MTLSANTILEVRTTGSDTNGGGFVTGSGGTDYSQQNSAQIAVVDAVTNGTTTITSVTANFTSAMVGNLIYVAGGTASIVAAWYQVVTFTSATAIVVDRATGLTTGTGATLNLGGALASPGMAAGISTTVGVAGMITYIKYTAGVPYTITSATTNISGGCCSPLSNTYVAGYDTTRALYTPFQNRPTIRLNAGVASATMYTNLNANYSLQSVILDANTQTSSTCAYMSGEFFYVKVMNYTVTGIRQNNNIGYGILCEATGGTAGSTYNFYLPDLFFCVSHDNAGTVFQASGFAISSGGNAHSCIAYNNAKEGFWFTGFGYAVNCVAYNNTGNGFNLWNSTVGDMAFNCIAEANGGYGYVVNSGNGQIISCAAYNNTSGRKGATGWIADVSPVNGSSSFFVSAGGGNFMLNNNAGGGALVRSNSFPSQFANLTATLNYRDFGAPQHQDSGGGAAGLPPEPIIIARGTPF